MSGPEPLTTAAGAMSWVVWEPLTPGNGLTLAALLIAAMACGSCGERQRRVTGRLMR